MERQRTTESDNQIAGIAPESLGFKGLAGSAPVVFLPPSFDIIPKLLLLLDDPEAHGESLAELIRLDPGLTSDILRVANSAAYASAYRMETMNAAVLRLGLREIFRIVLQVVSSPVFTSASEPAAGELDLWQHSLRSAIAAQVISGRLGEDPDVAFTAALLHDIGKLVFHQLFGQQYVDLFKEARAHGQPLFLLETARYHTDHGSVGGRLLKSWNFPDAIINSVGFHHDLVHCPKPCLRIVALTSAANLLAHRIAGRTPFPNYLLAPDRAVLRHLGLNSTEDLWAFEDEVKERFERENARIA